MKISGPALTQFGPRLMPEDPENLQKAYIKSNVHLIYNIISKTMC